MSAETILLREIRRYELEVWREDMRDPFSYWRTPRGQFYKQCSQAWREFTLAVRKIEHPPELWPCKRHGVVECPPCFAVWQRFHPSHLSGPCPEAPR